MIIGPDGKLVPSSLWGLPFHRATGLSPLQSVLEEIAELYAQTRHWDADEGVALSGANVTSWTDRLTGEVLTPPSTSPLYGAWWGEGLNAIEFLATADTMLVNTSSALAGLLGGLQKSTIITLAEPQVWDGINASVIFAANGGTTDRYEIGVSAVCTHTLSNRTPGGALSVLSAQGQRVRTVAYDAVRERAYHGVASTASVVAGTNATLSRATIGASYVSGVYERKFGGLVRHVIVVPGVALPTEQPALWASLVAALEAETTRLRIAASGGRTMIQLSTSSITRSESRVRCYTREGITGARFAVASYYHAPTFTKASNNFTVRGAFEVGGVNYPSTFRGASSRVVAPNDQIVVCDATVDIPPDTTFYVRVGAECELGQTIPVGVVRNNPAFAAEDQTVSTNGGASQVSGVGPMSETGAYTQATAFGPLAILGVPLSEQPVCLVIGDSIVRQRDLDGLDSHEGYIARGLWNGGRIPYISYDRGSAQVLQFLPSFYPHACIVAQWSQSKAVVHLGRNGISQSQTTELITGLLSAGCEVYWCLIPPRSTSTDTWATYANQTTDVTEAARQTYHAFLIAKIPATLAGVVDPLSAIEDPGNIGKWIPFTTSDGVHPGLLGLANDTVNEDMAPAMQAIAETWT